MADAQENSEVEIRSAQQNDMPSLLGLIEGKAEFDGGRHLLRASASELEEAFFGVSPGCEVLVADCESELLGFAINRVPVSRCRARCDAAMPRPGET